MFDEQFHQFIAPIARTTLPPHLSFPLHASPTPNPNTFLPFDHNYNPNYSHSHHFPLHSNLLHPLHPPPTHKHEQDKEPNSTTSIEIETDQTQQLPELNDSWTNDEVLALLRIRSTMENCFPQLTWDHVSRKLGEIGFKKSAEKCKEKFEEESRYFENYANKNNLRFLSELEELYDPVVVSESEKTHHLGGDNVGQPLLQQNSSQLCDVGSDRVAVERSKERKRKRRDRFEMFKGFCESVVNKMMAQQEKIHNRLIENMMKRDQEKFAREEAWKKQEMDRMKKELEIMAQEQAIAGDRHATIIEFLKKCSALPTQNGTNASNPKTSPLHSQNPNNNFSSTVETNNNHESCKMNDQITTSTLGGENPSSSDSILQVPSSSNSSPAPQNIPSSSLTSQNNNQLESINSVSTYKAMSTSEKEDVGRRWPRDEVLALINLRCTSVSSNNKNGEEKEGNNNNNNKGPLWARISQGMSELGYKRSAKRCKEKWENINKYFRKTKAVNKKRSHDSRTCPYFHQLSCLYGQGKLVPQSQCQDNPSANTAQDQAQAHDSSQVGSAIQYAC